MKYVVPKANSIDLSDPNIPSKSLNKCLSAK